MSDARIDVVHNLPSRLTSFIGREREIAEVAALLGVHRLVTLVGAPGVGKTRLGLQIATTVLGEHPDGVWLVELAPLADPSLVPQAVADVLGVRERPGQPLSATLAEYLRTRAPLLLIDNCEHLIDAVAALAEALLQACPRLRILATSREPLAIDGEAPWRVPSLSLPDAARLPDARPARVASLDGSEAARLFVDRARVSAPSFQLTDQNASVVAQICHQLDGIPLALELAAARIRALSVEQLAARLDDRFRLLTGGSRTALPRQRTLWGAVEWSYDLLAESERALLRRLAVFAGGFTLEAIEGDRFWVSGGGGVSNASSTPQTQIPTAEDVLISLVDKSLVQADSVADGETRYRLLETIREFGLHKLAEHGELTEARSRHRDYFLAFAEEVEPALTERPDGVLLTRIEREHDNLRAALTWCLDEAGTDDTGSGQAPAGSALGLRLIAATWRFLWLRGHLAEGHRWLVRMLAVPPSDTSPAGLAARPKVYLGIANLSMFQGDFRTAFRYMTESLAFCREVGDHRGTVFALHRLGMYGVHLGAGEEAARSCEESVALGRQGDDVFALAVALHTSGIVAQFLGHYEQSVALSEEAIGLLRKLGNATIAAYACRSQGRAVAESGEPERGAVLIEESLRMSREVGDKRGIAEAYKDLGRAALLVGDARRATEMFRMSVPVFYKLRDRFCVSLCLHDLARASLLEGISGRVSEASGREPTVGMDSRFLDAARLRAAASALREPDALVLPYGFHADCIRDRALLQDHLGEAAFAQAWAEGRAMSLDEAAQYALAVTAPAQPAASTSMATDAGPAASAEIGGISRREREIAVLLARGFTNRRVASALTISERTVETHVHNILGKLELSTRAQIAVWAVEHGLGAPGHG